MLTIHDNPKSRTSCLKTRIWPSLEFTIGPNHPPKRSSQRDTATRFEEITYWNGYKDITRYDVLTDPVSIRSALQAFGSSFLTDDQRLELFNAYETAGDFDRAIALVKSAVAIGQSPMGLSATSNSHKTRAKRGLRGITPYGKRFVRSSAALLEEKHGRACLTLGTCTLPPLEPDELNKVCLGWSDIVRKFFQEIQRLLARKGLDTNYVQVTEIQEKRFEKWGQVYPHLHWVVQGRKTSRSPWSFAPGEISRLWERLLSNVIDRSIDGSAATRIECPRKSLLAELGKYISKGSKVIRRIVDAGMGDYLPSSWWGCSKDLKGEVQKRIITDCGELTIYLSRNLEKLRNEGKIWFSHIYQEFVDKDTGITVEKRVGTIGRFNSVSIMNEILNLEENRIAA